MSTAATILIVEDDDLVAECLQAGLEEHGCVVSGRARSASEAVACCRAWQPNLAVVDVRIRGDRDGVETATQLRDEFGVPSIFLTGHSDQKTIERARAARPLGYLVKPFRCQELFSAIELALFNHEIDRRLTCSEANYRALVECATEPIFVVRDSELVYANPSALRVLDCSEAIGLVGADICVALAVDQNEPIETLLRDAVAGVRGEQPVEVRGRRSDGAVVLLEMTAVASDFDGEAAVVLFARDVTERRDIQDQLALAGRMASVGALAGGVAHEVNNPLTYVIGNLGLIEEGLLEMSGQPVECKELLELVGEALHGADRVRRIVRDLRIFSAPDHDDAGAVDVQAVLESCINMAWNEIRHRARLIRGYGDVARVDGSASRLGQVFLNMLINAAQSIPEGSAGDHEIRVVTRQAGDRVVIEVHDTGIGVRDVHRDKLFDPFFTTKEVGTGMGLGLSICHSIIHALGGDIGFEPGRDRGTVFRVVLPVASVLPQSHEVVEIVAPVEIPRRRGRVLVVDDDRLSGRYVRRVLQHEHDVEVVEGGRQALDVIVEREPFDVILCDLMMPDMNGMDLYRAVDQLGAGYADRMLFLTGGAFTHSARQFLRSVPNARLEKPLDVDALRTLVGERVMSRRDAVRRRRLHA